MPACWRMEGRLEKLLRALGPISHGSECLPVDSCLAHGGLRARSCRGHLWTVQLENVLSLGPGMFEDEPWAWKCLSRTSWKNHMEHTRGLVLRHSAEEIRESPSHLPSLFGVGGSLLLRERWSSCKCFYYINMSQKL